ncbi:MAG: hypothetical protein EHM12_09140 [Dehalococcoidia bacterium]|nr:MAG: hypothetical protein EHM12_09140 [Dehalococcoidia bacterium]
MSPRKYMTVAIAALMAMGVLAAGCDLDNNYDERTVVYVSNINDGYPFISDVINQGDSLYYTDTNIFKTEDDYIVEDWVKVQFHNRPYNGVVDIGTGVLGDFLVTGYTVEFTRMDGNAGTLVQEFTGQMSLLVPANSQVEAVILLVPYLSKNTGELETMHYSWTNPLASQEIFTNATITFTGHEVQTDRDIEFSAGLMVNFVDFLGEDDPNEH